MSSQLVSRISLPASQAPELECATWIWSQDVDLEKGQILEWRLDFRSSAEELQFEVSADQRYQLFLDGVAFGRGPDRAEVGGWSVQAYRMSLSEGSHCLEARVWWFPEGLRPMAQCSVQAGFALWDPEKRISTGFAPWKLRNWQPWSCHAPPRELGYHVIGPSFEVGPELDVSEVWEDPVTVHEGRRDLYGHLPGPWRLAYTCMPEQISEGFQGGVIRAIWENGSWQELPLEWLQGLTRGETLVLPPGTELEVIWDAQDYLCAYPRVCGKGGKGSRVEIEWAESLFDDPEPFCHSPKGQRDRIAGKTWLGFGDVFHLEGDGSWELPWWRSGRFLKLKLIAGEAALELRDLRPLRCGYPYRRDWELHTDLLSTALQEVCERGLISCVHETFVDCPYYEQMMYLGDTRIQALTWMLLCRDARPVKRALELFDRSRWVDGFCLERCPSWATQHSSTYSLIYPLMLRDYAWWREDADTVCRHLPGMRAMLETALACVGASGLPEQLPGWLYVDWVKEDPYWVRGVPGLEDEQGGLSAPILLHMPPALEAAADLEEAYGSPHLALRWREAAEEILKVILDRYWSSERNCLSDDLKGRHFSEHAQALALSCQSLPELQRKALVRTLVSPEPDMAQATVYFSYHVLMALLAAGELDAFCERLSFWEHLPEQGYLTTVESPEPARSDCHGWGAHPLYHGLQGLAGITSAAPGFAQVRIQPLVSEIEARVPHPLGEIQLKLQSSTLWVHSPVPMEVHWDQRVISYPAGAHLLTRPLS